MSIVTIVLDHFESSSPDILRLCVDQLIHVEKMLGPHGELPVLLDLEPHHCVYLGPESYHLGQSDAWVAGSVVENEEQHANG